MMFRSLSICCPAVAVLSMCLALALPAQGQVKSDREQDGLVGSVMIRVEKRVRVLKGSDGEHGEHREQVPYKNGLRSCYDREGYRVSCLATREPVITSDEHGQKVETQDLPWGTKIIRVFNRLGRRVEEGRYNVDGSLFIKWVTSFNDEGGPVETSTYIRARSEKRAVDIFDEFGRKAYSIEYSAGEAPGGQAQAVSSLLYLYDLQGRLSECTAYKFEPAEVPTVSRNTKFSYDANGQLSEEKEYDRGVLVVQETYGSYRFDPVGNWIRRTVVRWDVYHGSFYSLDADYRSITYH